MSELIQLLESTTSRNVHASVAALPILLSRAPWCCRRYQQTQTAQNPFTWLKHPACGSIHAAAPNSTVDLSNPSSREATFRDPAQLAHNVRQIQSLLTDG